MSGPAPCGAAATSVCIEASNDAEPGRIEAIESMGDAERCLRSSGWTRTRAKAFLARVKSLRDESAEVAALEQAVRASLLPRIKK